MQTNESHTTNFADEIVQEWLDGLDESESVPANAEEIRRAFQVLEAKLHACRQQRTPSATVNEHLARMYENGWRLVPHWRMVHDMMSRVNQLYPRD